DRRREETLRWFERHGAAFVCVDAPEGSNAPTLMPNLDVATRDDVAYLRAHGRNLEGYLRRRSVAERFAYRYDDEELEELGERARQPRPEGRRGRPPPAVARGPARRDPPEAARPAGAPRARPLRSGHEDHAGARARPRA